MSIIEARQILQKTFGFESFRLIQETVIQNVLHKKDQLALMPTGGGKSLCYQIPALLLPGTTIVISPLIALMEDQVANLSNHGIKAAFYNSSLDGDTSRNTLRQLYNGELDLFYISPERLLSPSFLSRIDELNINLFAIDEAHCVSQWGHDFRKDYADLGQLKQNYPYIPILALTATADLDTRKDIIQRLCIEDNTNISSFLRKNLRYQVLNKHKPLKQIQHFIDQHNNEPGIIYCSTRKSVEKVHIQLQTMGYKTMPYHAGLTFEERSEAFHAFKHDEIDIIVATIAFGMGVDKSNIRFVIHYDLPKSIENFYQETGRAGRDGLTSDLLLLYQYSDCMMPLSFIEQLSDENQQLIEKGKLFAMVQLAEATSCRQQIMLNYFNEPDNQPCGQCDNCLTPVETIDKTIDAQKILSCIYRLGQNYGMQHVIDVLRSANKKKVLDKQHDKLSTYGLCKDQSEETLKHTIQQLIQGGLLRQALSEFNVLKLTEKARPVLKGEIKFEAAPLRKQLHQSKASGRKVKSSQATDNQLLTLLKSVRTQLAKQQDVPPFMIFSDASLVDMSNKHPTTESAFLDVHGVGQFKVKKYSEIFLKTIESYLSDKEAENENSEESDDELN